MLYQVSFNIHNVILLVMTFIVILLVLSDVTFLWGQLMRVFLSFMGQQASVKLVHGTAAKSLKSHAVMLMDFMCVQKCRSDVSNDCSVGEMVASPHLTLAL